MLSMDEDARLARQLGILFQEDMSKAPYCDACEARQNKTDLFFVCKICPNTDLCEPCMEKYEREDVLTFCHGHDFLRVVASEARFQPSDTHSFNHWLDGLIERFNDV